MGQMHVDSTSELCVRLPELLALLLCGQSQEAWVLHPTLPLTSSGLIFLRPLVHLFNTKGSEQMSWRVSSNCNSGFYYKIVIKF